MQQGSPEDIAARAEAMMQAQGGQPEDGMGMQRPERPRTAGRKPPKVTSKVKQTQDDPGLAGQGVMAPTIIAEGVKDDDDEDMFEQPAQQGGNLGGPMKAADG